MPTYQYKNSYPCFLTITDFPAGFAYLASALRGAGHEVFGLNPNNDASYQFAYEMIYDRISRALQEVQPELIGLGGLCTDYQFIKDAMHIIRELAPDVPIVCGGAIINNDAEYIFKLLRPDFCIIGEGEERIVQLADTLEGNRQDYDQIENLGYWKKDTALFTKLNFKYTDINQRHFPDYEPFGIKEMLDKYSLAARNLYRYTRPYPRPMVIVTARGCPFSCTFCVHRRDPGYRVRSVENIIKEIILMYERYSFNILLILDELFAVNKSRMSEFCTALLQARETHECDFDWSFQTHANARLDHEVLELAKKAGCYFFSYGLESASPRVLASMNKKTRIPQIIEAIKIADSVDIGFGGNFIFGDPAETEETTAETMDFLSRYCGNIHAYLGSIQPYPGSKVFEDCIERGLIRDKFEFYEHIDEDIVNMTSIPDRLWLPWVSLLSFLSRLFLWVKPTNATRCVEETGAADNPITSHSGKSIWQVWTRCPHCGKEAFFREMVGESNKRGEGKGQKPKRFFRSLRQPISILTQVLSDKKTKKALALYTKCAFFYLLNFRHSLFKSLKAVLADRSRVPFFITGCPHCNRRFKVNLPMNGFTNQFGSLKTKLLLQSIRLSTK